ncbi:MAG: hypothetical protein ACFFCQ_01195 [Promethearchaeota archaeon]
MEEVTLIDLPSNFFMSSYHKIQHLKELAVEKSDPIHYQIIFDRLYFLLHDLREMRISKIITRCLTSHDLPPSEEHLTKQEQRFIHTFWGLLKNLREIKDKEIPIADTSKKSLPLEVSPVTTPKKRKNKIDFIVLRFLAPVKAFVGADGLNYGPFSASDVAVIPSPNAYKVLIPREVAEEIEVESDLRA